MAAAELAMLWSVSEAEAQAQMKQNLKALLARVPGTA
jgi:hypothetical protein